MTSQATPYRGCDAIADVLTGLGVRTVFAVAGASHTFLLTALKKRNVSIISSRHETGAIASADGYARISGGLGIALIITEQGLPNAIGGLALAYQACSPVLVLLARSSNNWIEAESEYDTDKQSLVAPISKWARTPLEANRLAEYVWVGAKAAQSGRKGPAVLNIPAHFLGETVERAPATFRSPPTHSLPTAPAAEIEQAAEYIATAEKPLVIAGAGARWGDAGPALRRLSSDFGIPVVGNSQGRGLVPEDWETGFSWPFAQIAAREADCVVWAGARFKQRLGFGLPPRFAANAKFIQIDLHAEELHRNRPVDLALHADTGKTLTAIADALDQRSGQLARKSDWLKTALEPRIRRVTDVASRQAHPVHPLRLPRALMDAAPKDMIYVGDGADIQTWMYGYVRISEAPGFLDHYPLGSMGVGTPLAVGAAAAARDMAEPGEAPRRVVLMTGDGSFGFYPAELHAAEEAKLPITVVIANDGAWGSEYHEQKGAIGETVNTMMRFHDYEKIGEAFGCAGRRVDRESGLPDALRAAFESDRPTVINVITDREAGSEMLSDDLLRMLIFTDLQGGQTFLDTKDGD